jgi:hypothetical protein
MDDNYTIEDERPVKKFKINFNVNKEEKVVDIDEELNAQVKKYGEVSLLSKSIQQMKLELAAEDLKKRVNIAKFLINFILSIESAFTLTERHNSRVGKRWNECFER